MSRPIFFLIIFLWLGVLLTALAVVVSTQEVRDLTSQLSERQSQQNRLQVEWGKYLLEESALASFARLEAMAQERLGLSEPKLEEIVVVDR